MKLFGKRDLKPREWRVIELVADGKKNYEIGAAIGTTDHVIKNYLRVIYDKTGSWDRLELTLWYLARTRSSQEQKQTAKTMKKSLHGKERKVVGLLLRGCENKDIAKQLGIARRTVKAHCQRMFLRFGITSGIKRVQLAKIFYPVRRTFPIALAVLCLSLMALAEPLPEIYNFEVSPDGARLNFSFPLNGQPMFTGNDVYITQSGNGTQSGLDCTNTKPASYFNSSGNWSGSPSGALIGPATIVHATGTFTGTLGSTMLTFQGNGSSGSPVTLLADACGGTPDFTSPAWGSAINTNGKNFLVIDGGGTGDPGAIPSTFVSVGIIENTANGTVLANKAATKMVLVTQGSTVTIRNWRMRNIYQRSGTVTEVGFDDTTAACIYGGTTGLVNQFVITNNSFDMGGWCLQNVGASDYIEVSHNEISNMEHSFSLAPTTLEVHHNHFRDWAIWDVHSTCQSNPGKGNSCTANNQCTNNDCGFDYHHDGGHVFAGTLGQVQLLDFYDNQCDGSMDSATANMGQYNECLFVEGNLSSTRGMLAGGTAHVFNNVCLLDHHAPGCFLIAGNGTGGGDVNDVFVNNTMVANIPNDTSTNGLNTSIGSSVTIENNASGGFGGLVSGGDSTTFSIFDYNFYNSCTTFNCFFLPFVDTGSFTAWKAANCLGSPNTCDQHGGANLASTTYFGLDAGCVPGSVSDPCAPQAGSPLLNAADNLTSKCSGQPIPGIGALCFDKNGVPRPSSGSWTAGAVSPASLSTVYVSQSGGSVSCGGDGTQSTISIATYNASSPVPDETDKFCGTFTSTEHTGSLNGTSGHPITLLFEAGAKFSKPTWGNNVNVMSAGATNSWVIVDGGTNGLIENTNNGSSPTYPTQDNTTGVDMAVCNHCEIRSLNISNLFVKNTADAQGSGQGIHVIGSSTKVHDNVIHDVAIGIGYNYPTGGTVSAGEIYRNTIYHANQGSATGDTGAGATFAGLLIHDNECYDFSNWDDFTINAFHHNCIFVFVTNDDSRVSGLQVYNQYVHGDMGNFETGHIFLDGEGNGGAGSYDGALIFDNLLIDDSLVNVPSNGLIITKANGGSPAVSIYGNVEAFNPAQHGRCNMNQGAVWTTKNNIRQACSLVTFLSSGTNPVSDYNVDSSWRSVVNTSGNSVTWVSGDKNYTGLGGKVVLINGASFTVKTTSPAPTATTFDVTTTVGTHSNASLFSVYSDSTEGSHSITSDPLLTGSYMLPGNSPALGIALNLTSLGIPALTIDRAGFTRPNIGGWDPGAYQSSSTPPVSTTSGTGQFQ